MVIISFMFTANKDCFFPTRISFSCRSNGLTVNVNDISQVFVTLSLQVKTVRTSFLLNGRCCPIHIVLTILSKGSKFAFSEETKNSILLISA